MGHLDPEFDDAYFYIFWFFLKSILIYHLNNSNQIRNEQVMAEIRNLVETGKQSITCTSICARFFYHNVGFSALFPYY